MAAISSTPGSAAVRFSPAVRLGTTHYLQRFWSYPPHVMLFIWPVGLQGPVRTAKTSQAPLRDLPFQHPRL